MPAARLADLEAARHRRLDDLVTDRSDASGTGYWSGVTGEYRLDLLERAFGRSDVRLPRVLGPAEAAGRTPDGVLLGPGAGDNAGRRARARGRAGDVVVSIGTSGVVSAVSDHRRPTPTGIIAGFASATGEHLPLVCTLNAARVLDAAARILGVDHAELARLALSAPPGADGLVLVPYLEGERTPNRPDATGALHGLTLGQLDARRTWPARPWRACCAGSPTRSTRSSRPGCRCERAFLVGGGARSEAVARIAPAVLGRPVLRPTPGEYVADGAARQAAWVLAGADAPPVWAAADTETFEAEPTPAVRERYAQVRDLTAHRCGDRPPGRSSRDRDSGVTASSRAPRPDSDDSSRRPRDGPATRRAAGGPAGRRAGQHTVRRHNLALVLGEVAAASRSRGPGWPPAPGSPAARCPRWSRS